MGGGGSTYDRDTVSRSERTERGYSRKTEQVFTRSVVDKLVLPFDRKLITTVKSPVVSRLDNTGSMGTLPKMMFERAPNMALQQQTHNYLDDPAISLGVVGDIFSDAAPLQVGDFVPFRGMDNWLRRLWLESGGGPGDQESYEMIAWFDANRLEMPNAVTPIYLMTGDERFYDFLEGSELTRRFGGQHRNTTAKEVFDRLLQLFNGNVFLLHRKYGSSTSDAIVLRQWEGVIGSERILPLVEDASVVDVALGVFALVGGTRSVDDYAQDMRTRIDINTGKPDPQSEVRIANVRRSLEPLVGLLKKKQNPKGKRVTTEPMGTPEKPTDEKPERKSKSGSKSGKAGAKKPRADWRL